VNFNAHERKNAIANIIRKYATRGNDILSTSQGNVRINSPFIENITIIVNSSPRIAVGFNLGMNFSSYHVFPLFLTRVNLVIIPAMTGMPRNMMTLLAISVIDICRVSSVDPVIHEDNTVMKK